MSITLISGNEEIVGTLEGTTFTTTDGESFEVTINEDGTYSAKDKIWSVKTEEEVVGGRKRRSSKKSKKGGNKHTMTMGGKKYKKTRKH